MAVMKITARTMVSKTGQVSDTSAFAPLRSHPLATGNELMVSYL
uniref:Uncharacterized protein n=1 Tax=Pseudomonas syringae pv. actinidiae TaxID=103796 RepID=A0A650D7I7_PSESF|nr:hypothetical protein [Pseudomonas syringae pv. actinidiae]